MPRERKLEGLILGVLATLHHPAPATTIHHRVNHDIPPIQQYKMSSVMNTLTDLTKHNQVVRTGEMGAYVYAAAVSVSGATNGHASSAPAPKLPDLPTEEPPPEPIAPTSEPAAASGAPLGYEIGTMTIAHTGWLAIDVQPHEITIWTAILDIDQQHRMSKHRKLTFRKSSDPDLYDAALRYQRQIVTGHLTGSGVDTLRDQLDRAERDRRAAEELMDQATREQNALRADRDRLQKELNDLKTAIAPLRGLLDTKR